MDRDLLQGQLPQIVEKTRKPVGKARVKPRHLSQLMRTLIVEQFEVRQSSEDVAEELGIPVRTVSDVINLHNLRRGPLPELGRPQLVRRTA